MAIKLVHQVLNIVLPLTTVILVILIYPLYLVFKLLNYIKRSIFSENVAGKVVLITGASSGIGEYVAYEYARRGARLALAARREENLRAVADKAQKLGSPDVVVVGADVAKVEDCKRIVDETLNHFGQLDHLVSNAAIAPPFSLFQDCKEVPDLAPIMDINFWGSTYCTSFALPHLKKSRGKIVVVASVGTFLPVPRFSVYNASKAALVNFYETLRFECGSHIGVTIVYPGLVETEMSEPYLENKYHGDSLPLIQSAKECAEGIVKSTCRGDKYLTEPSWFNAYYILKVLCPELFEWSFGRNFKTGLETKNQASPKKFL